MRVLTCHTSPGLQRQKLSELKHFFLTPVYYYLVYLIQLRMWDDQSRCITFGVDPKRFSSKSKRSKIPFLTKKRKKNINDAPYTAVRVACGDVREAARYSFWFFSNNFILKYNINCNFICFFLLSYAVLPKMICISLNTVFPGCGRLSICP